MQPTIGRTVHYTLNENDAKAINRRRGARTADPGWPDGAQAHVGNAVGPGDIFPMVIVHVWDDGTVNGQVFLDGNDVLWVTSVELGDYKPGLRGTWCWPPRES